MDISSALHVLSHELRGPTAVIQGYARLLGAGDVEPATAARVLWHASSYETCGRRYGQPPDDAVGYASVVVG